MMFDGAVARNQVSVASVAAVPKNNIPTVKSRKFFPESWLWANNLTRYSSHLDRHVPHQYHGNTSHH